MKTKEKQEFYKMLKSGKFADMVKESAKQGAVSNSSELYNIVKPLTEQEPDIEQFWVLFLDADNNILEISMMFKGTLMMASVYPRELIKKVIDTKAAAVICSHNHPSGNPEPSREDIEVTFQLLIALKSIGVTFHEHLVVGNEAYHSMADNGVMSRLTEKYNRLIND